MVGESVPGGIGVVAPGLGEIVVVVGEMLASSGAVDRWESRLSLVRTVARTDDGSGVVLCHL